MAVNVFYLFILIVTTLTIAIVASLVLFIHYKKSTAQFSKQKKERETISKSLLKIQQNIKTTEERLYEVQTGFYGISDKVVKLEKLVSISEQTMIDDIALLSNKIRQLEVADPGAKLYSQAVKLVASGATIEEIILECDLPRAEVELLVNLHSK